MGAIDHKGSGGTLVFLHALEGILSILAMVLVGYALAARGWFNQETTRLLPRLVNYVSLPTYMLWNLTTTFSKDKLSDMVYGLTVPLLSMLASFLFALLAARLLKVPVNRRGTFISSFFASSAIFVGVPVNLALFGESSLPFVLLYFLANALWFWTVGNYCISMDGETAAPAIVSLATLRNIFSPPLISFTVALLLVFASVKPPAFLLATAKYLGSMTTPLSLLFIGVVMHGVNLKKLRLDRDILGVLIGRFIVSPLAVLLVAAYFPIPDFMKKVFVIQAALPAMTQTSILASMYKADVEYAATLVSVTNLAALIAIPIYMTLV